jgi:hypothetical protein
MNGCLRMDVLRISQDLPQDLPVLLERNEFHRARRLLERYPSLDTAGQRSLVISMARDYEDAAIADALEKESKNDFVGALNIIDTALFKIPDSTLLPAYRAKIDDTRKLRLRFHKRSTLLAESHYLTGQQRAYRERENLRQPGFLDKWQQSRHRQTAKALIDKLFDCNRTAIKDVDLETAGQCLDMIDTLDPARDTRAARANLNKARMTQQQDRTQIARIKYAREQQITNKTNKQRAAEIMHETESALADNDLLLANNTFRQMPDSESNSPETVELAARLVLAVKNRVSELVSLGDRHYRADRVSIAITAWSDALLLEPGNTSISERLERARKVLARLDELKKKQRN